MQLPTFTKKVGVAPSTTMMRLPSYQPYATVSDLRGPGLGLINPGDWWWTGRTYGLPGTTVVEVSPRQAGLGMITREAVRTVGVQGLGSPMPWPTEPNMPNDFQMAPIRGYLPYRHGWIVGKPVKGGLGSAEQAVEDLAVTQKRQFWLQLVTTIALTSVAAVSIYGALRNPAPARRGRRR